MNRDKARYVTGASTYATISNLENYVTKGMISWLDGYYHTNHRDIGTSTYTLTMTMMEGNNTESGATSATSGVNLTKSYYAWTSVYGTNVPTFTNTLSELSKSEGNGTTTLTFTQPDSTSGKY